jgi:hypothetical protein
MAKFKVGQKVWVSFSTSRTQYLPDAEDTVKKAGTKNVHLKYTGTVFSQNDGVGQGNYNDKIFASRQELDNFNKKNKLASRVYNFLANFGNAKMLSMEDLEAINKIIEKY